MRHFCRDQENMTAWCGEDTMSLYYAFDEVDCIPCLEKFVEDAKQAMTRLILLKTPITITVKI